MKISDIKIGKRIRKNPGDIRGLADSIRDRGLLHPIVVRKDNRLVAGWRRIQAFKLLHRTEIPHSVVDSLEEANDLLMAERDENSCREPLTPSEAVAMGAAIEALETPAALKRKQEANKSKPAGNLPEDKGRVRDKVGEGVGMSGKTYQKAKAVVAAAKENPEKFEAVQVEMDKTGNIDKAFKAVKRIDDTDKLPFEPQVFNIWNFQDRNPAFGIEYPGNIPGDIIQNLLWLYTEKNDVVIDPFAGGCVTMDVCNWWTRKMWPLKCLSLDTVPSREKVIINDITKGYPKTWVKSAASLVFLDPPYWKQKKGDYKGGNNLADMPLKMFNEELIKIISASANILKPGGHVAVLIGATRDGERHDHAAHLMAQLDNLELVERIIVPYSSQQAQPFHVSAAKKGKLLLNRYRDLLIWKK